MHKKIRRHIFEPSQNRKTLLVLAGIMAMQTMSYTFIMPIFARRLGQLGAGVEALGLMAMAYSLTNTAASPFLGTLADRIGRRPLVLGSLAAYAAAFSGYLFAPSPTAFIIIRALAGALTAGLAPAVMGIVADIAPADENARWIGVVSGGASVGWVIGPTLGGFCFDRWGFAAPFAISIGIAVLALLIALLLVPETGSRFVQNLSDTHELRRDESTKTVSEEIFSHLGSLRTLLPQPFTGFFVLLAVSFTTVFAYAFIEPQLMIYVYEELGWSSARLGMAISGLGMSLVFGQTVLGHLSDKVGRKPVLIAGILLSTAMYATISFSSSFLWIALAYIVAGLGEGLMGPALSALYLDLSREEHKSRVMGIKAAAEAIGGAVGPGMIMVVTGLIPPQGVFIAAVVLLVGIALLVQIILKEPALGTMPPGKGLRNFKNGRVLVADHI